MYGLDRDLLTNIILEKVIFVFGTKFGLYHTTKNCALYSCMLGISAKL